MSPSFNTFLVVSYPLSAFRVTAPGAVKATFFKNELLFAVGAFLGSRSSVFYITF